MSSPSRSRFFGGHDVINICDSDDEVTVSEQPTAHHPRELQHGHALGSPSADGRSAKRTRGLVSSALPAKACGELSLGTVLHRFVSNTCPRGTGAEAVGEDDVECAPTRILPASRITRLATLADAKLKVEGGASAPSDGDVNEPVDEAEEGGILSDESSSDASTSAGTGSDRPIGFTVIRTKSESRSTGWSDYVFVPVFGNGTRSGTWAQLPAVSSAGGASETAAGRKGKGTKLRKPAHVYKLTPLEMQFMCFKHSYPDTILFLESGYRYRLFGIDAVIAANALGIECYRHREFVVASVPTHRAALHADRLANLGHKVALVTQQETAAQKKANMGLSGNANGLFARGIGAMWTACTSKQVDTLVSTDAPGVRRTIAAIVQAAGEVVIEEEERGEETGEIEGYRYFCLAVLDGLSGALHLDVWKESSSDECRELAARLAAVAPREVLIGEEGWTQKAERTVNKYIRTHGILMNDVLAVDREEEAIYKSSSAFTVCGMKEEESVSICYVSVGAMYMHTHKLQSTHVFTDTKSKPSPAPPTSSGAVTSVKHLLSPSRPSSSISNYFTAAAPKPTAAPATPIDSGRTGVASSAYTGPPFVPADLNASDLLSSPSTATRASATATLRKEYIALPPGDSPIPGMDVDMTMYQSSSPVAKMCIKRAIRTVNTYLAQFNAHTADNSVATAEAPIVGDTALSLQAVDKSGRGEEREETACISPSTLVDVGVVDPRSNYSVVDMLIRCGRKHGILVVEQARATLQQQLCNPYVRNTTITKRQDAIAMLREVLRPGLDGASPVIAAWGTLARLDTINSILYYTCSTST
jgi:hypothetical protein